VECETFPMIYGKGRTSNRAPGIVCGGINSDVYRMERTEQTKEHQRKSPGREKKIVSAEDSDHFRG